MHSGFADTNVTSVTSADGTFGYTYAGEVITPIIVTAGTTLEELVDLINSDSDNPGVQASILDDGKGTASSQHLVISGKKTGAANKITSIFHTLDNFDGNGIAHGGFSETQQSTNSMMKIDGYPSGFKDSVDNYTILKQIGISTALDGMLELDESVLREELGDDPEGVVDLLTNNKKVVSDDSHFSHYSSTSDTTEGTYIKFGKSREFDIEFEELLDEDEGITKVLIDNYENIMDNIDKRIEKELNRVDQVEARLKAKYANMEVALQEQNSQMERLQQSIASLP